MQRPPPHACGAALRPLGWLRATSPLEVSVFLPVKWGCQQPLLLGVVRGPGKPRGRPGRSCTPRGRLAFGGVAAPPLPGPSPPPARFLLPRGSPLPSRHVRRLVPAPLPARGSAARAAAAQAALQPCALPAAPLPARLRLGPRHRRRSTPPRRPARAQSSAGPRTALERRLRRVSAPSRPPPPPLHPDLGPPCRPCWAVLENSLS